MTSARPTDPETSHAAAASVDNVRASQKRILTTLKRFGAMTDEMIYNKLGLVQGPRMSQSGARSRRAELVELGLVRDSGRKADTLAGRKTIIWEAI